jgi:hypothetical protein
VPIGVAVPHDAAHFAFRDDNGSFAHGALRCLGVGKGRETDALQLALCGEQATLRDAYPQALYADLRGAPNGEGSAQRVLHRRAARRTSGGWPRPGIA